MDTGIDVFAADEQNDHAVELERWRDLAEKVVDAERRVRKTIGLLELSVVFVDEQTIADLNERFRNVEGATDVLSFSIDDVEEDRPRAGRSPDGGSISPTGPKAEDYEADDRLPTMLGDVVICPAVAARNAPEHAGTYDNEMALLVVHGVLHLFGMDHEANDDATKMEARERELLHEFYGDVPAHTWPDSHGMADGEDEDESDEDEIDLTDDAESDEEDDDDEDEEDEDDE